MQNSMAYSMAGDEAATDDDCKAFASDDHSAVVETACTSQILYTDTPRLVPSPSYSAMSASPALSGLGSPAAAHSPAASAMHDATVSPGSNSPRHMFQEAIPAACQQTPSSAPPNSSRTRCSVADITLLAVRCNLWQASNVAHEHVTQDAEP